MVDCRRWGWLLICLTSAHLVFAQKNHEKGSTGVPDGVVPVLDSDLSDSDVSTENPWSSSTDSEDPSPPVPVLTSSPSPDTTSPITESTTSKEEDDEEPECDGFACHSSGFCMPLHWTCDDVKDCVDGSDEMCDNGIAVPDRKRDEFFERKEALHCSSDQYACQTSVHPDGRQECVGRDKLCDDNHDCTDGSDEGGFCGSCRHKGCEGTCTDNPILGPTCSCPEGMTLSGNGFSCLDRDECMEHTDDCDHYCINVPRTYHCSCAQGFVLANDEKTCELGPLSDGRLLLATGSRVVSVPLKERVWGSEDVATVADFGYGQSIEALDFNPTTQRFFASSSHSASTGSNGAILAFGEKPVCLVQEVSGITSLTVDWVTGNVYFAAAQSAHQDSGLYVCTADGKYCTMIYKDEVGHRAPGGLTVNPQSAELYWVRWERRGATIVKTGTDGQNMEVLVDEKLEWPNALSYDPIRRDLYWADPAESMIEAINLITGKRRIVVPMNQGASHPYDLVFFDHHVYWSDWQTFEVHSADVRNPLHIKSVHQVDGLPHGIAASHPFHHSETLTNPCRNSPCSHICVLKPTPGNHTFACLCPFGYRMKETSQTTCELSESYGDVRHPKICEENMQKMCKKGRNPCENGGLCSADNTTCGCLPGFTGLFCEVGEIRPMEPLMLAPITPKGDLTWIAAVVIVLTLLIILGVLAGYYSRKKQHKSSSCSSPNKKKILENIPSVSFLRRGGEENFSLMENGESTESVEKAENPLYKAQNVGVSTPEAGNPSGTGESGESLNSQTSHKTSTSADSGMGDPWNAE